MGQIMVMMLHIQSIQCTKMRLKISSMKFAEFTREIILSQCGIILSYLNLNMPIMRFFDFHIWDICFRVMILEN